MSRFRNAKPYALSFDLRGVKYRVDAHGEVEIPSRVAHGIASRGLPLVLLDEADAHAPKVETKQPDAAAFAEVMAKLESVEDIAAKAQSRASEAETNLAEVEAATRDFTDAIRARIGIGADDKILDALDVLLAPKGDAVPEPKAEKPAKK